MRKFKYTKDNGDVSHRKVIVITEPRKNMLVWDVSDLSKQEIDHLRSIQIDVAKFRNTLELEYNVMWVKSINSLWRSFKPECIEYED